MQKTIVYNSLWRKETLISEDYNKIGDYYWDSPRFILKQKMASINGGIILDKEWENIQAVQKMQDYIEEHEKDEITLYQLASACGYSHWHAARLFKQYIGRAPFEYIRALKLSKAAMVIRDENVKIKPRKVTENKHG